MDIKIMESVFYFMAILKKAQDMSFLFNFRLLAWWKHDQKTFHIEQKMFQSEQNMLSSFVAYFLYGINFCGLVWSCMALCGLAPMILCSLV